MFRRSRFSIRPNVGTAGRAAAAPQEAPSVNQEAGEPPKDVGESSTATAVTESKPVGPPSEKLTAAGDGNDQNGEGSGSSAAVQRRKRFSVKPKVAPGRPSTLSRTPKSPVKAISETPVEVPGSDLDKPTTSSKTATTASPQGLQSPRRRRPSEDSKQPKVQQKPTLISSDSSEPSAVPPAEDSPEQTRLPADSGQQLESTSGDKVKEVPVRLPDKVPPSIPEREAIEISEKARTLVSSKCGLSVSEPGFTLSRLLNDPSDLQRLAKAKKLRELLREEMHKEKRIKKAKTRQKEFTLDPAKMTMRDLIRYLPVSNPMTSSLEDPEPENETVVPPSPGREESPERAQEPEVPKNATPSEEEEEEAAAEEDQDESLMVPQVKVAEDGSLIIDEESLTVEVQRAKGPNLAQDRDPIFERGSTTTYSSFRKGTYAKPWSTEETDMFFLAISMVGTDFSMICQLFPHRARSEIKNKFKKEERANTWRIDKAFKERRKLDIEYFSKLLEKILEVQKNRKKLKSLAEKNSPKKRKRKAKGIKPEKKLSDVEEEDEEEENELPDLEREEGEKENEDLCNESGAPVSKPKKKCKRKDKQEASAEEPNAKKNKTSKKSSKQDEAHIPEDAEAALPEDRANSDMSEKTEENANAAKDSAIKPAKLSRGRAAKPVLPLGRKWGKKPPPASTTDKDAAPDKGDESVGDGASKEQVNEDASPVKEADKKKSAREDVLSEEEDEPAPPPRPTRYGRVPKPTKPLNYPAKDDSHSSASETTPASPAGSAASAAKPKPQCKAKRGRSSKPQSAPESKKPKLVTLRASQSEPSDEEDENQWEEEEGEGEEYPACSPSKDSSAQAFVPASLRSPQCVISEVEETMEELDILANMPDVLGISQDALCPDTSFELTQNETGTPCEHQLDLLVDVIDFLSAEHTEVSAEESYNEAAQTLLTIGNLAHLSQSAQNQTATQDPTTTASVSVDETSQHLGAEVAAQEENSATPLMSATSVREVRETPETFATAELQSSTTENTDMSAFEASVQRTGADTDPIPQFQSTPEKSKKHSPQTRRGRLSKVKPQPNLGRASRTAQSIPETSTVRTAEESQTDAADSSQATETAPEDTFKTADCCQNLSKDDISCIEVKLMEDPSASQESSVGQVKSSATPSDQSSSENQNSSGAQFDPSGEQATGGSSTESPGETLTAHPEATESSCDHLVTSDTAVPEEANVDSAPAQQSSDHPAAGVSPVEDSAARQKEESGDTTTHQTRRSRFQKVKPKPNLPQTSRTVRSKPQTTTEAVEKDSNPTPNPELVTKAEVEAQPACSTSPERPSQSTGPSSDLIPSLDLVSTLTPAEELSTTDVGTDGQVESGAAASNQSASENRNCPKAQFEPSLEQATRDTWPTSELAVTELQAGQGSDNDSATVQESGNRPAPGVSPAEDSAASQKEESEDTTTHQTRRSRFQKVKPKPNLLLTSRAVRSRPQTTKDTIEKESILSESHEETTVEVGEPTCTTSVENTRQTTGPASNATPLLDVSPTLTPKEELSTTEEKKTNVGVVGQVESGAATSALTASGDQSERPTSESTEEKLTSESSCSNPLTSDSAVPEPQVGRGSNIDSEMVQESSNSPAPCVTPAEDLSASQKEETQDASAQTRRSRFQKVKPKLNLPQTSRTVRSKPQTRKETVIVDKPSSPISAPEMAEVEAQQTCSSTPPEKPSTGAASVPVQPLLVSTYEATDESSSPEGQTTDVGGTQESPQRMRRFPKVKPRPNLGSSTRTAKTKPQSEDTSKPSEQHHQEPASNVTSAQKPVDKKHVTSTQPSHTELLSSAALGPAESGTSLVSTDDNGPSDGIVIATSSVAENRSVLTDSSLQNKSSETPTVEGESPGGEVDAGPSSQWDSKQDMSLRLTETNTQPAGDPTAISDAQSLEEGSEESKIQSVLPSHTQSTPVCSESHQTAPLCTDDDESQSTDSSTSSRKAPRTRRGRLVKPKPNLGRRSQPQQIQDTKQAEADSSEAVDASVSPKLVSELGTDVQQPAEGAVEQRSHQNNPPNDSGSLLMQVSEQQDQHDSPSNVPESSRDCLTHALDNSTQDAPTSGSETFQILPSLTIYPDILTEPMPSDPDEPFFILSLTEIPVCPSGEVVDGASEPLPYLPPADASVQPQSSPPETDGPLSNVAVAASMEGTSETGLASVKDPAADTGSIMENPVDPHAEFEVQPSVLPEAVENNDETEPPPPKQRRKGTGRTAKPQVRPKTARRKPASKACDEVVCEPQKESGDHVEEETQAGGRDPEEGSSAAKTTRTRAASGRNRKPKEVDSFLSETNITAPSSASPTVTAASEGPKVKTPRAAGKQSTQASVASSCPAEPSEEPYSTPSVASSSQGEADIEQSLEHRRHPDSHPGTSLCAAEVSVPQHGDVLDSSCAEEEPTSVCQYFLSDIFTEVEEA